MYGFEEEDTRQRLVSIEAKLERGFEVVQQELEGLESRLANYVMSIMRAMANEARNGPRLFTIEHATGGWPQPFAKRYRLNLWCEAEDCQHPVDEPGKGVYEFEGTREWVEWVKRVAPYASFIARVLKMMVPIVTPAVNAFFGPKTMQASGLDKHLDLVKTATGKLASDVQIHDPSLLRQGGVLTESERSGILALHAFLRETDPNHERLGLTRIPTYTGDYLWLCREHYQASLSKIPDKIE